MTGGATEPDTKAQFSEAEITAIRESVTRGDAPRCPRCNVAMTRRDIGGGSFGLGYARRREWLICRQCRRSAIFDRERGTRT